jgi:uncharacterized protein YoxC
MEPVDILFLTLSVSVAIVSIFLSVTLVYLLFILRDVVKVTDKVQNLVEKVDTYITKPLLLTKSIIEFLSPFVEGAKDKIKKRRD